MSSDDNSAYRPGRVPIQRPGKQGSTRAQNRIARTQELCNAALELFLAQGIESTTVDEITASAQVAKGTFYRYFDDKVQLVEALLVPLSATLDDALARCNDALSEAKGAPSMVAAYQGLALELSLALSGHRDRVRLYLQECRAPRVGARVPVRQLSDRITQSAIELTQLAHDQQLLKPLPPTVTALAVVGAAETLLARYLDEPDLGSIDDVAAALVTMMLGGVAR